jgi:phosphoglycolate phosphatase-like HAD superfamily hydrolase
LPAPVVLFDLDGTVLTFEGAPPGPGRTALELAMHELFGSEHSTAGLRVAGGTDRALARAMLLRAGLKDDDDRIARVLSCYVAHLEYVLRMRRYRPIGAIARVVAALRGRGAVVGIATGNVRGGARLKLASAGLGPAFDLTLGAFGCDAEPRAEIVRLAAERCRARATAAPVVVVGDTEHDVHAARAVGARVIGVATDAESRAELEAAGADAIVDGCDDDLLRAVLTS